MLEHVLLHGLLHSLEKSRRAEADRVPEQNAWVLRHSWSFRLVSLGLTFSGAIYIGLLAFLFWLLRDKVEVRHLAPLFLIAGLSGFMLCVMLAGTWDAFFGKVVLTEHGLCSRRPTGIRTLLWNDLEKVEYGRISGDFVLSGKSGAKARLSTYLDGLGRLRTYLEQHLPSPFPPDVEGRLPRLPLVNDLRAISK